MSAVETVLGVTGSIGAYKAADIVRKLRDYGCVVNCVMTERARQFMAPLTLQALSERKVYTDLFSLEDPHIIHTRLADTAKLILIAPATANVIAKLANGVADDLLTCIALASKAPILIAPAMNVHMYSHPIVQDNIKRLRKLGHRFVGPALGNLACGYEAIGHLADVDDIVDTALRLVGIEKHPSTTMASRPVASKTRRRPAARKTHRSKAKRRRGKKR